MNSKVNIVHLDAMPPERRDALIAEFMSLWSHAVALNGGKVGHS